MLNNYNKFLKKFMWFLDLDKKELKYFACKKLALHYLLDEQAQSFYKYNLVKKQTLLFHIMK